MEKSSQNPSFGQEPELVIIAAKAIASAVKKNRTSNETIQSIVGKSGPIFDFFEKLLANSIPKKSPILRIFIPNSAKPLSLKALNGKRYIYNAKETFAFIDEDFKAWNLNKAGVATPETLIQVHEMCGKVNFIDIFSELPGTWSQKWFSQDQIIEFCETFSISLKQSNSTKLFLAKNDEERSVDENNPEEHLVVVCVFVSYGDLRARVYKLSAPTLWEGRNLVISPQLTSQNL